MDDNADGYVVSEGYATKQTHIVKQGLCFEFMFAYQCWRLIRVQNEANKRRWWSDDVPT